MNPIRSHYGVTRDCQDLPGRRDFLCVHLRQRALGAGRSRPISPLPGLASVFRFPVQQDRNGRGALDKGVDEKPLPVARSGVPRLIASRFGPAGRANKTDGVCESICVPLDAIRAAIN